MAKLRIVFMGTPEFAMPALRALGQAGHQLVAVYCQPPKPSGRGHQVHKTPVHQLAETLGIQVFTPKTLRDESERLRLADLKPDMVVVAAYGLILPQTILDIPPMGCLNIHGSLLPRWRGAAPIQRALLAGDRETGITIMKMEAGLDTGAMFEKGVVSITDETTARDLHDQLAQMGAELIVKVIDNLAHGRITPTPQPQEGVTYAAKLLREEGLVDWQQDAAQISRQVRALNPWPGTYFMLGQERIKLLTAQVVESRKNAMPGTLEHDDFTVACGSGAIKLSLVQRSGKNPTDGASLLRGLRLSVGQKFS